MRKIFRILVPAGAIVLVCATAGAQTVPWDSYAVKFVCGNVAEGLYAPGVDGKYKTSVNIHNPHHLEDFETGMIPVQFFKKIVLAPPQGSPPVPPSCFLEENLRADHALSVTCRNIIDQLALSGLPSTGVLEGFVVILVPPDQGVGDANPPELDVSAVYTGRSRMFPSSPLIRENGVSTFDVESVAEQAVRGTPDVELCDIIVP